MTGMSTCPPSLKHFDGVYGILAWTAFNAPTRLQWNGCCTLRSRNLAKITINMGSSSQWVSKMCRLFFADEYARRTVGTPTASLIPDMESAFQAVQNALPKLETRIIEFLSEWLVTLLMPAKHVLETRSPHLSFMLLKEYWFRELYLGLKVTASFDRTESYVRVIDRHT